MSKITKQPYLEFKDIILLIAILISISASLTTFAATEVDETLIDPTRPFDLPNQTNTATASPNIQPQQYILSSILIRENSKVAVVNSKRVKEGDTLGAATILSIEKEQIQIQISGKVTTLSLYKSTFKTPVLNNDGAMVVIQP